MMDEASRSSAVLYFIIMFVLWVSVYKLEMKRACLKICGGFPNGYVYSYKAEKIYGNCTTLHQHILY